MKKILVLIIFLFAMLPIEGKSIHVIRSTSSHKGIAHVPTIVGVEANYEHEIISICISNYAGIYHIYINNDKNFVVKATSVEFAQSGKVNIDVADLPQGEYTLEIVLDNGTYVGTFEITE